MQWEKAKLTVLLMLLAPIVSVGTYGQNEPHQAQRELVRAIYKELIETNTTHSVGNTTVAAQKMADRLIAAGFPKLDAQVLGEETRNGNVVARLHGTGARKPLLLLAHLDVVEARREDWSTDPFTFIEQDGYFYGRGSGDDKSMAAIWVANLIRMRQEGFKPDRDIIMALTAGEEGGDYNGVTWLLEKHRDLIDAEYALNEGGSGVLKNGKRLMNEMQPSEKVYVSFRLEVRNRGGHSSLPRKDNAIYELADGLTRLERFGFPVHLTEVSRGYFERMSEIESGQTAADMKGILKTPPDREALARLSEQPAYNARLRTTCVATQLEGGHAENALPQLARAIVNCRLIPSESPLEIQKTLVSVLADVNISVAPVKPVDQRPEAPLNPEVMKAAEKITAQMWPGIPVVPTMSTGATDGSILCKGGIPAYGISGIFSDIDDVREHGRDERLGVREFYEGDEFLYRLVKELSTTR